MRFLLLQLVTLGIFAGCGRAPGTATIHTPGGDILIELSQQAPKTVASFKGYVRAKVYQDSAFHSASNRYIFGGKPGVLARGSYSESGNYNPTSAPPLETGFPYVRGGVCMARTVGACNPARTSNSTQFTIYTRDRPDEANEFTVFARVIKGMDVVDSIAESISREAAPVPMSITLN